MDALTNPRASQPYLCGHPAGTKAAVNDPPLSRRDRRQSEQEEGDETARRRMLRRFPCAAAELPRTSCMGKQVEIVPSETNLTPEVETILEGGPERRKQRSSQALGPSAEHPFAQAWTRCGRFTRAKCWRPSTPSMRRTQQRRYRILQIHSKKHHRVGVLFDCWRRSQKSHQVLVCRSFFFFFHSSKGRTSCLQREVWPKQNFLLCVLARRQTKAARPCVFTAQMKWCLSFQHQRWNVAADVFAPTAWLNSAIKAVWSSAEERSPAGASLAVFENSLTVCVGFLMLRRVSQR